jgi:hypothetical protein
MYPNKWLRVACDDLNAEIQRTHHLFPQKFPVLGFEPEKLRTGSADPLLNRWRRELGDEQFLRFLKYWYWHSLANQPLAFVKKIARQLGVFYSLNCPAVSPYKDLPLSSWAYAASFSTLADETETFTPGRRRHLCHDCRWQGDNTKTGAG